MSSFCLQSDSIDYFARHIVYFVPIAKVKVTKFALCEHVMKNFQGVANRLYRIIFIWINILCIVANKGDVS